MDCVLEGWKKIKEMVTIRGEGLRKDKWLNKRLVKRYSTPLFGFFCVLI